MSYRLPPLTALRAFESAARHLSFKKAAEELYVTPAAVSQQIKALESYLNVTLFRRLTRSLELTPQGLAMLPKICEGFECLAAAVEMTRLKRDEVLSVTAPPSFASRWLVPRLSKFAAQYPDLRLHLSSSGATIDQRGEAPEQEAALLDPLNEVSEVAIRYGLGKYSGLCVHKIFAPDCIPVCSPRLLVDRPPLIDPADLRHYVLIHDETIGSEDGPPDWPHWMRVAGVSGNVLDAQRGPRFSNGVLAVEAAVEGQGVALALRPLIESDVAAGRLIIPIDLAVPSPYAYFLVYPKLLASRPSVQAFREWLLDEGRLIDAATD